MEQPQQKRIKLEDDVDAALKEQEQVTKMLGICKPEIDAIHDAIARTPINKFVKLGDLMVKLMGAVDGCGLPLNMQPRAVTACLEGARFPHHGACVLLAAREATSSNMASIYTAIRERSMPGTWNPIESPGDDAARTMTLSDMYVTGVAVIMNMHSNKWCTVCVDEGEHYSFTTKRPLMMGYYYRNLEPFTASHALLFAAQTLSEGRRAATMKAVFDGDTTGCPPNVAAKAQLFKAAIDEVGVSEFVLGLLDVKVPDMLECMYWEDVAKLMVLLTDYHYACVWTMTPVKDHQVIPAIKMDFEMSLAAKAARAAILVKGKEVDPGMYMAWVKGDRDIFADAPLARAMGEDVATKFEFSLHETLFIQECVVQGRTWQMANVVTAAGRDSPEFVKDHTSFLVKNRPGVISESEAADLAWHFDPESK